MKNNDLNLLNMVINRKLLIFQIWFKNNIYGFKKLIVSYIYYSTEINFVSWEFDYISIVKHFNTKVEIDYEITSLIHDLTRIWVIFVTASQLLYALLRKIGGEFLLILYNYRTNYWIWRFKIKSQGKIKQLDNKISQLFRDPVF